MEASRFSRQFSAMRGTNHRHIGYFWPGDTESDPNGACCSCGWEAKDHDAQAAYDRWGKHVDEVA